MYSLSKVIIFIFAIIIIYSIANKVIQREIDAYAQIVSDDNFKLDIKTVEPKSEPNLYNLKSSNYEQNFNALETKSDYKEPSISYLLSSSFIDYGDLIPGEPIIRTNTITVLSENTSYQVIAWETHPLQDEKQKIEIPDTTCDDGSCSEIIPSIWKNPLVYGFGYRCDNLVGFPCVDDFKIVQTDKDKETFKQFSNINNEKPQTIIKAGTNRNDKVELTYKLNIPNTQVKGIYQNNIIYLILPRL